MRATLALVLAVGLACAGKPAFESSSQRALRLSEQYAAEGRYTEALREVEIALRRNPAQPALLLESAALYESLGAPTRAAQALEEAVRLEPHDPAMWVALGDLEMRRERIDSATAAYRRARALDPLDPGTLRRFAVAAERAGVFDEAAEARVELEALGVVPPPPPVGAGQLP